MRLISTRSAIAIAGFAVAAAFSGTGAATADPMSDLEPLLNSSCSFSQIDAALHAVSPETAAQLDAAPAQKTAIQTAYEQPGDQRRTAFQTLISQQQQMGVAAATNADFGPKLSQVVDTCSQY